ncbi:MAG: RidA family protein, partial [Anaerolineales bacterium]|nr:RidA family protein [Anaerolineales bacterium]
MSAEARVKELGIEIPAVPGAAGNYVHAVRTGNLLFLSGKGPKGSTGKVGADVAWEDAYQDAREVGLYLVAVMREYLGSLDKVVRIVKVLGMVNAV